MFKKKLFLVVPGVYCRTFASKEVFLNDFVHEEF